MLLPGLLLFICQMKQQGFFSLFSSAFTSECLKDVCAHVCHVMMMMMMMLDFFPTLFQTVPDLWFNPRRCFQSSLQCCHT